MKQGTWKEEAFQHQISQERDFPLGTLVKFKYAICCGHRTGSNLLGEALYKSGVAGDPMEYFNLRFLKRLMAQRNTSQLRPDDYLQEMQKRRTSPNGVFGVNVKIDQLNSIFSNDADTYSGFIKDNDFILYLYRRDKIRQAISVYIGQSRDLFNVPAEIGDDVIGDLVETIPYNAKRISQCLDGCIQVEQAWLNFFENYGIAFEPLAYEDFIADYEGTIKYLLEKFGVPKDLWSVPSPPMKKVSNQINNQFREKFSNYIQGTMHQLN